MKSLLIAIMLLVFSISTQAKEKQDFPLLLHVTAVEMQQGTTDVVGSGNADPNTGNYSSSVTGGGSYTWQLFTAKIEGANVIYSLSTSPVHFKGGRGLAIGLALATGGTGALITARKSAMLHVGDYHARWNKDGTLEIELFDAKGKNSHQTFRIESEKLEKP